MVIPAGFEPSITSLKGSRPDLLVEGTKMPPLGYHYKCDPRTAARPFGRMNLYTALHTRLRVRGLLYPAYPHVG